MNYYLETRVAPNGRRSVIGGQAEDGKPLLSFATKADAETAASLERARVFSDMTKSLWVANVQPTELNIRPIDELRLVGRAGYMHL